MTDRLIFTNTRLQLTGKKGIIKPDSEGYYEFPVGAFNCQNSAGEVYTNDNIDRIFSDSSAFMRKVTSGKLYGEWGHPLPRYGEPEDSYVNRASNVEDKDTCVFFKEIWNDSKAGKHFTQYNGIDSSSIITFARLKPHGALWETLQRAIDDPNVNIAFSVRNFGRDRMYRGKCYVSVEEVITYDAVSEQGVASSEKYGSLKLEHHRVEITPKIINQLKKAMVTGGLRMESMASAKAIIEAGDRFYKLSEQKGPSYADWK